MIILGLDTTGQTLSAALSDDDKVLCEIYLDSDSKHAQTALPMIDAALALAGVGLPDVDVYACSVGPGSFTGIRIGISLISGMAHAAGKPVAGVGTLDALVKSAGHGGLAVCAIMDARRGEVYAVAKKSGDTIVPACAMPLADLLEKLPDEPVVFTGDAAVKYKKLIEGEKSKAIFLAPELSMQRAGAVCAVAHEMAAAGMLVPHGGLRPVYLRESQAERMRRIKLGATHDTESCNGGS